MVHVWHLHFYPFVTCPLALFAQLPVHFRAKVVQFTLGNATRVMVAMLTGAGESQLSSSATSILFKLSCKLTPEEQNGCDCMSHETSYRDIEMKNNYRKAELFASSSVRERGLRWFGGTPARRWYSDSSFASFRGWKISSTFCFISFSWNHRETLH